MKVNCLHCGHGFAVDNSYSDYEGLLRCPTCAGLLEARFEDGLVRSVRPGSLASHPPSHQSPHQTAHQAAHPAGDQPSTETGTIREAA